MEISKIPHIPMGKIRTRVLISSTTTRDPEARSLIVLSESSDYDIFQMLRQYISRANLKHTRAGRVDRASMVPKSRS